MCIAVFNPPNVLIKKWAFQNCWDNNKDGAGILYLSKGRLKSYKQLRDCESFYKKYKELRSTHDGNMVIHFRKANYGDVNLVNCHPFVYDHIGFVHNGTIRPCLPGKKSKSSDTKIFGNRVLKHLNISTLRNPIITELISYYIGNSKLIVMDKEGNYEIVNEEYGEWNGSLWFSNDSYLKLRNPFDRDYGYCTKCDKRLFGSIEESKKKCYECQRSNFLPIWGTSVSRKSVY